jgi:uncharacterized protein YraI
MARKKKRWRDMDDPTDIFGHERPEDRAGPVVDPNYDAFRRHMEEHIQGETRAFHELRSKAEHELQAAAMVSAPARRSAPPPPPRKTAIVEAAQANPLPPAAIRQAPARPVSKGSGLGTMVAMGLIFTAIGFLLHHAWQQTQPLSRKGGLAAKSKMLADCSSEKEKVAPVRRSRENQQKTAAVAPPPAAVPEAVPVPAPVAPQVEATAAEPTLKGITLRAVELRKGPGQSFEIVDSLPPGFSLEGDLTTDRQWLRVKPGAFVSVDAVQFQDAAAGGYQAHWVGANIANIREFPLTTARILRKAQPGTELNLQVFNSEWAQLADGGFVFRKLVTSEAPRKLQLPAVMRVSVEKAEIRGGPGAQYPVLGLYFRNHKVEVQELESGWLRVGPDQYMRAQELELASKGNTDRTL